ncbi:DsbE family thiol:disulfide interchange protein [Aestuariibacter salexigens]|uniref:DsbE family thiol:disulfide interchange protein n=1 Tax=Aestuariibacter salexigens TaxID=226010 RepID=UPI0003FBE7F4|nr:DsbE family thiol:disulfide interchange protein [Aestuariibacter salexigens]
MKKLGLFILPLGLFMLIAVFLYQGLYSNPRERQSMVLDNPVPDFSLPDLMAPQTTYTPDVFNGQVTLLNVWGVWCVTCAVELPYLTSLREQGVRIVGLYYDQDLDPDFGDKTLSEVQQEVTDMLSDLGNPYQFNIYDVYRDLSLDLGVTGAPETFLIDHNGVVRVHHIGDLNSRVWRSKFAPMYQQLSSDIQVGMP